MPMRTQYARSFPRLFLGTIEIAGDVETRYGLEVDLLDGVVTLVDDAVNNGIQR
jgi:hypothetical protein